MTYCFTSSIRIPSSFNGFYGLRPSSGRIPFEGCVNSTEGQDSIPSVIGPLSASLSGVKIFMKAVLGSAPWARDPLVHNLPWNEDKYQLKDRNYGKKLCFAILWNDGLVVPHPPIRRAMEIVKKALAAKGHEGPTYVSPQTRYNLTLSIQSLIGLASAIANCVRTS